MAKLEWKDARTHREPKWPFGGYAPGNYSRNCLTCGESVHGVDKRATQCLPCAMDEAQALIARYREQTTKLEASVRDLDRTIRTLFGPSRALEQDGGANV